MRYRARGVWLSRVGLALWLALSAGCSTRQAGFDNPKTVLQDYISESFNVESIQDRDGLLRYLTGSAKNRLAAWSDEQFQAAFIKSRRQLIKLEFVDLKNPNPNEAGITYELTYLDQNRGQDAKVIHRKAAQLIRREDRWLISEVRNLKEMIEYKNEMSLP
ncbi:MAG: hypothetical protein ACK5QT_11830 [Oligoflexia bacterium]|jgi:hypothetical protein